MLHSECFCSGAFRALVFGGKSLGVFEDDQKRGIGSAFDRLGLVDARRLSRSSGECSSHNSSAS